MPRGEPNKRYTGEFKKMVAENMINNKMSYPETDQIGTTTRYQVKTWYTACEI